MVMAAREGENVVRLKGGDPFIFGRGGEEVEHLRAAGIEVQVVNGITSGLAAVTSLGVPLTHREHAHGVVFVTGHAHAGSQGADWRALAAAARDAKLTLVIYMGVSGAARIQQELLTALPASTPVAIVQRASLPDQRHAVTTLGATRRDHRARTARQPLGDRGRRRDQGHGGGQQRAPAVPRRLTRRRRIHCGPCKISMSSSSAPAPPGCSAPAWPASWA